jgi:hypothetical protein
MPGIEIAERRSFDAHSGKSHRLKRLLSKSGATV